MPNTLTPHPESFSEFKPITESVLSANTHLQKHAQVLVKQNSRDTIPLGLGTTCETKKTSCVLPHTYWWMRHRVARAADIPI